MIRRLYPDGAEFAAYLNTLTEGELQARCVDLINELVRIGSLDASTYSAPISALNTHTFFDTTPLKKRVDELDGIYDSYMDYVPEDVEPDEDKMADINSIHWQARSINALIYALELENIRDNTDSCIYECIHSQENVNEFLQRIKVIFGMKIV